MLIVRTGKGERRLAAASFKKSFQLGRVLFLDKHETWVALCSRGEPQKRRMKGGKEGKRVAAP
jgi:hypothetical protein